MHTATKSGLDAAQHLAIVAKRLRRSQLVGLGPGQLLVHVRHSHDFDLGNQLPGEIQVVPVVARAGGSDYDCGVHQVCSVVSGWR